MSSLTLLLTGLGVGVVFSAPVGPVNILCVQRAFRSGFFSGLAAGLGAVMADGLFAAVAAFGITAVSGFIEGHSVWLQVIGGVLLIAFGIRTARVHPHLDASADEVASLSRTAFATFGMTITNPATVLGFLALFGSLGDWAPKSGDWLAAGMFVVGVVAGGSSWWLIVATAVAALRDRMTDRTLARINLVAGALLVSFGVAVLARLPFGGSPFPI
ncbi:LysE family translocator [Pinisolibacter aquiterrae]|uniref:LysE family translocator n=1 Tax=Pinisolibacter aquiterrae TaxID=2815579 RepID=UPI001C3E7268|nr:LysE family transporter [Pinisolibacter aquiterrae]MBV5262576.1 LysE family transporter [Pinisolibacter aquiterrae]MCC8237028.1 LysE family translocator [Pinisolibacter aquiterrae]